MVYAVGLAENQPRIDSVADCRYSAGQIAGDQAHGWCACHKPISGRPRKVTATPSEEQL
jgi:hypothetical protein